MKAVVCENTEGKPGEVYHPLKIVNLPAPIPKPNELLIKIQATALNHRDLFCRQKLYPGAAPDIVICSDGAGTVVSAGTSELEDEWKGRKVILAPARGWASDLLGPEGDYSILGGTKYFPTGTLQEYIAYPVDDVEPIPLHLSIIEAAALPVCGLTAYRAIFTKVQVNAGQNVLVTGIGGGVALYTAQFAIAQGAMVFVTSSSDEKLQKAKELGVSAGVNYKNPNWEKDLRILLPKNRPYLDCVIDGAGGDIVSRTTPLLKNGGIIVSYGMTLGPQVIFSMKAVLKNIEMRGSTMGSRKEFAKMVQFVSEKQIRPVISHVSGGIDRAEECFEIMRRGQNFGKLVVTFEEKDTGNARL